MRAGDVPDLVFGKKWVFDRHGDSNLICLSGTHYHSYSTFGVVRYLNIGVEWFSLTPDDTYSQIKCSKNTCSTIIRLTIPKWVFLHWRLQSLCHSEAKTVTFSSRAEHVYYSPWSLNSVLQENFNFSWTVCLTRAKSCMFVQGAAVFPVKYTKGNFVLDFQTKKQLRVSKNLK